jgi:hypothetical protein
MRLTSLGLGSYYVGVDLEGDLYVTRKKNHLIVQLQLYRLMTLMHIDK